MHFLHFVLGFTVVLPIVTCHPIVIPQDGSIAVAGAVRELDAFDHDLSKRAPPRRPAARVAARPAARPLARPAVVAKKPAVVAKKPAVVAKKPLAAKPAAAKAPLAAKPVPPKAATAPKATPPKAVKATSTKSAAKASATAAASCARRPAAAKPVAPRSPLDKRAGTPVCGIDSRDDIIAKCQANAVSFTLDAAGAIQQVQGQAAGTQCDHVLELQVLKDALDQNGACVAMDAMAKAAGINAAQMKSRLLAPLFTTINGGTNAFFLDPTVNNLKKTVVARGFGQKADFAAGEQDAGKLKAVKDYLALKTAASKAIATRLDTQTRAMVNNAEQEAKDAIACGDAAATSTRQQQAQTGKRTAVTTGKAKFTTSPTVTETWDDALAFAARQA